MEKILLEVQEDYSEIMKARTLMVQNDFARASEIYSNVLSQMAEKEKEDGLKMSVVYLEYAKCLLLSNDSLVINPEIEEDNNYLEDLGIAWELLEIAKRAFTEHNLKEELINVHLLLSDISQETNNFVESLNDLLEIYRLIKEDKEKERMIPDILLRIAFTYEALDQKEEAISTLNRIIEIMKETDGKDREEIISEVEEKIDALRNPEKYKLELKQKAPAPKMDTTQPVQKIKTVKKKQEDKE